jgi:hypothetical protein
MENLSDVSSEEELVRLRDQGKISEVEYGELLAAMQKTAERERKSEAPEQPRSKRRRGKIAFALMLLGVIGPFVLYSVVHLLAPPEPNMGRYPGTELLAALALEVAAFAMGISAWPDVFAKAAVGGSGFSVVVLLLFTA